MATDVERLVVSLEANIRKYEREMERSRGVTEKALREVERSVSTSTSKIESSMARVCAGIRAGLVGALAGVSVSKLTELTDGYTRVQNQLKISGLEGDKLNKTFDALFQIAQKQGAPLEALATLYGRVSGSQKELNTNSTELLQLTSAVALALRVNGTSATEASGALLQLGQALGSGKVQFEEFGSLQDGLRPLLQAAASGIEEAGGSVNKLTQLVKEGKLSSEAFYRGIQAGLPVLEELAKRTKDTSDQGVTRLRNALLKLAGEFEKSVGASEAAGEAISLFADKIEGLAKQVPGAIDLLRKLGEQAESTAKTFGNLEVFKFLADRFADKDAVKAIEKSINEVQSGTSKSIFDEVNFLDKNASAGSLKGKADELRKAAGDRGLPKVDRISIKKYPVSGDKDKKGGGGSGAEKDDDFEKEIKAIEKRTRVFDSEREAVGKSALEVAKAEGAFRLLEAAQKAGTPVTDALRGKIDALALSYANAKVALDKTEEKQRDFEAMSRQTGAVLADGFKDAVLEGEKLTVILDRLIKSLASKGIDSIFDSLFAKGGAGTALLAGSGGGLGGLIAGITGRAGGGPVKPGTAYTVGESGRETFVPTSPGRIVPAGRGGRRPSISIGGTVINAPGADAQALAQLRGYVDAGRREDRRLIGQSLASWKENN